jgi:hypothetical protein
VGHPLHQTLAWERPQCLTCIGAHEFWKGLTATAPRLNEFVGAQKSSQSSKAFGARPALESCVFISFALKYESVEMQLNADPGIFGDLDIFGNEQRLADDSSFIVRDKTSPTILFTMEG